MSTTKLEQIEALLEDLSREEQLTLIKHIARRLCQSEGCKPQPLYGIWKGKFPEDVNIDETLQEIRNQWQEDLEEFKK